ncbi:MAG TPA: hypothetical protein VJ123_10760 [Anaerolineales bacterium]|nr:hypothetical protein [Anaerolineales bacterium]
MEASTTNQSRLANVRTLETWAWLFMRYSGILLIPLVWIHVAIQDVLVGVHAIDLDYVAMRWATLGWRIYDVALLAFTLAHGMNGLRAVTADYLRKPLLRGVVSWSLLVIWLVFTIIGGAAIVGGVRAP